MSAVAEVLVVRDFDAMAKRMGRKLLADGGIRYGSVVDVAFNVCEDRAGVEVDVIYHSQSTAQKAIHTKQYDFVGDLLKEMLES